MLVSALGSALARVDVSDDEASVVDAPRDASLVEVQAA
jgi:hypothetical protein